MAYEIDFIGVDKEKCKQDADAICLRWKTYSYGCFKYKIGVVDGGFEIHGEAMTNHINEFYFDDPYGVKASTSKTIDFMVVTHPDQDHAIGLKKILENFNVEKIYMNRPWLYISELFDKVNDGRITRDSLSERFKKKYKTIADIEVIANEKGIPIYEAFQGTIIEDKLKILSPSKSFYLNLLVESNKTPLEESAEDNQLGESKEENLEITNGHALSQCESWTTELLSNEVKTSAENETSIVVRGLIDGSGFLLTGDAGIRALTEAMDYMDEIGEDVQTEISYYQIPHHGGRHNVSPLILDRMIGSIINRGNNRNKYAIASVAKDSDHPRKMVTNAYIRRGVVPYKTTGSVLHIHEGNMPLRRWGLAVKIEFSNYVEEWDN